MLAFKFCILLLFLALFTLNDAAPRRKSFEKRGKIRRRPKNEDSYVREDIAPRDLPDRASNSCAVITSDSSSIAKSKSASNVAVITSASGDSVASSDIAASSSAASTVSSSDVASSTATNAASTSGTTSSGDDGTASTNIKVFKKRLLCKKWKQDLAAGAAGISSDSSSIADSIVVPNIEEKTSAGADNVASSDVGASSTAGSTVSSSDVASSTAVNIASKKGAALSGDDGTATKNIEVFKKSHLYKKWNQDLAAGAAGISSDSSSIAESRTESSVAVTTSAGADSVASSDDGVSSLASSTVSSSDVALSTAANTASTSGASSSGGDSTASTNVEVFKNWNQDLTAGAANISSDSSSVAESIAAQSVAVTTSDGADSVPSSDVGGSSKAGSTVSSSNVASSTTANIASTSGATSGDDDNATTNVEVFEKSNQDLAADVAGIGSDSSPITESIAASRVTATTSTGADGVASSDVGGSSIAGSAVSSSNVATSTAANTASTSGATSSGDDGTALTNIEIFKKSWLYKKWNEDLAAGAAGISYDSSSIADSIAALSVEVTTNAGADSVVPSDVGASSATGSTVSSSDFASSTAANAASTRGAASSSDDGIASKNIEVFKKWNQDLAAGAASISSNYSSFAESIAASSVGVTTCASAASDVSGLSTANITVSSSDHLEKCFANIFGILFGLFVNTVKNGIEVVTNELTGVLDRIPTGTANIS